MCLCFRVRKVPREIMVLKDRQEVQVGKETRDHEGLVEFRVNL